MYIILFLLVSGIHVYDTFIYKDSCILVREIILFNFSTVAKFYYGSPIGEVRLIAQRFSKFVCTRT